LSSYVAIIKSDGGIKGKEGPLHAVLRSFKRLYEEKVEMLNI